MNDAPGYSYAGPFDMVAWYKMDEGPGAPPQYVGPYDSLAGWWKLDLDYGGPVNGSTDGLVAWYKMDEGTGTLTTADSSGNNNTGYLTNSPAWANGVVGSGLKFNGVQTVASGTYIGIPNSPSLQQIQSNITISAWFNAKASVGVNGGCILAKTYGGLISPYQCFAISLDVGMKPSAFIGDGTNRVYFSLNSSLPTNTWYNLLYTYNGSQIIIYTNGIFAAATNCSLKIATNNVPVTIGSSVYLTDTYNGVFDGTLDDVRIYNRALSASEITAIYQAEAGIYAIDSSTNNNLTLVNDGVYTNGVVGGGLAFSLSPNPAKASISAALNITNGSITLCAWCYPTNLQSYNRIVLKRNGDTAPESYSLGLHNGKVSFENSSINGYNQYNSIPTISTNTFSHVAITYTWGNSASTTTYINGVAVSGNYDIGNGTSTSSDASPTYPVTIGGESNSIQGFGGVLDDVRIYNRVLTINEIANIYRAEVGNYTNYTADSSGNGNTGYFTNSPAWTNGVVRSGLKFNGVQVLTNSTYIVISNSPSLQQIQSNITISAWVNAKASVGVNGGIIVMKTVGSQTPPYEVFDLVLDVGFNLGAIIGDGSTRNIFSSNVFLNSNTWYHCSFTYNGSQLIMYTNGITIGTTNFSTKIGTNQYPVTLGSSVYFADVYNEVFDGTLDDVRIYNRALSASEIANIYNTEIGNYTTDSSGNGNTGYLTNSPAWTNGVVGSGLYFNTNQYVYNIGTTSTFNFVQQSNIFTMAFWLKLSNTNNPSDIFLNFDTSSSHVGFVFSYETAGGSFGTHALRFYSARGINGSPIIDGHSNNNIINDYNWHFCAVTSSGAGNNLQFFCDGIAAGTTSYNKTFTSTTNLSSQYPLSIGGNSADPLLYPAFADDVRIYNRALSSDEILKLYNGGYGTSQ